MKQFSKYKIILIICFCIWIITTTLQISNPHPYRGLIGNIILVIGLILSRINAKKHQIKSPLYDPNKVKHIWNWIVFILLSSIVVAIIIYLQI